MKDVTAKPLVIDVDNSLLRTDMLLESFWVALGKYAPQAILAAVQNLGDRARLKHELATLSDLDVSRLPINDHVLEIAHAAQAQGRDVVLASASDQRLVNRLADRLGLQGDHFGSTPDLNLAGEAKGAALVARYGDGGFAYIGDAPVDLKVWAKADEAIAVNPSPTILRGLAAMGKDVQTVDGGWYWIDLLRAMRPHQWIKNILLLLPFVAAQRTDFYGIEVVLMAIVAFSFAASSIYIVNDLLDLDADRQHERKKNRPFAAGTVPIKVGMITSVILGILAISIAASIGWKLLAIVVVYMSLSLAYSVYLKALRWVDIWVLATLYTLRVVAGSVAASVAASGWFIAFVFPVFMSLGCVKRLTELARSKTEGRVPGRAYARVDRPDLLNMSVMAALFGNIIFLTYSYSETAQDLYVGIWELRWCVIPISAWMVRMISTGWAGTQNYDPIVFALRDRIGLALSIVIVLGLINAAGGWP